MTDRDENLCPFCGDRLESGYLVGDAGNGIKVGLLDYPLQWFSGEPTPTKTMTQLGESIGGFETLMGSYVTGTRCAKCRKMFLDY